MNKYYLKDKYINNIIIHNNRGITLATLILTLIITLIISGMVVYTGIDLFEKSVQRKQITKLTLIQSKVKSLGEENLFNGKELVGTSLSDLSTSDEEKYNSIKFQIEGLDDESFYLLSYNDLKSIGLNFDENEKYLVNYATSEIVTLDGIKIEGENVYKLSDIVKKLDLAYIYIGEEIADRSYELIFKDGNTVVKTIKASYHDNIEDQWPTLQEIGTKGYQITFDSNGGTECESQKANYTFDGWYASDGITPIEYTQMPAKNETLYARWQGQSIVLPLSAKNGYVFTGWYENEINNNGSGELIGLAGGSYTPEENKTIYAYWQTDFEANYSEIAYIQATGTQYINTGFCPNQDTRWVLDMNITYGYCMGCGSVNGANFWLMRGNSNNNLFYFAYNQTFDRVDNIYYGERNVFDVNKNILKINNSAIITLPYATSGFSISYPIFIFASNTDQKDDGVPRARWFAQAKLYSSQIYDNGILVRDFVPCTRNSDTKPGLYDKVNKIFYINQGSGEFTIPTT